MRRLRILFFVVLLVLLTGCSLAEPNPAVEATALQTVGDVSLRQVDEGFELWLGREVAATLPEAFTAPELMVEALPGVAEAYVVRQGPLAVAYELVADQLVPLDYYHLKAPPATSTETYVIVDKGLNVLWLYQGGEVTRTWRVSTGRQTEGPPPTWQNYKTNYFTPEGTFTFAQPVKDPDYVDLKTGQYYPGGSEDHPLGNVWLGFSVLEGDGASIWAIHGTNEPESIGHYESDGCIRLQTEHAEELLQIVQAGMRLQVLNLP